jgi:hypothetical protein
MKLGSKLLYAGYDHYGAKLDLYGLRASEDEGYVVTDVMRAGTSLNLTYLFSDKCLDEMGFWMDAGLHEEYLLSIQEAKADIALRDRQMAQFDHQWRSL